MPAPAKVLSAAVIGLEATLVEVEVDIGRSLPNILIVGLPDAAVQEARERVRAAIKNSGLRFPSTRVTVNLAPGDVRKEGPLYDLPVALAVLAASEELPLPAQEFPHTLYLGELALDGSLRPVSNVLSAAALARRLHIKNIVVPAANVAEAALIDDIEVLGRLLLSRLFATSSERKKFHPRRRRRGKRTRCHLRQWIFRLFKDKNWPSAPSKLPRLVDIMFGCLGHRVPAKRCWHERLQPFCRRSVNQKCLR